MSFGAAVDCIIPEDADQGYQILNQPTATNHVKPAKGGYRATFFVFVLTALDNMVYLAAASTLVLYFVFKMHFDLSHAANTLTNLLGWTFLLSVVGGVISDTFIDRFLTCLLFVALQILGFAMMAIQAHTKSLLPGPCGKPSCVQGGVAAYFYMTLCLLGLGIGGVRATLPALGADQFDENDPKEAKKLASYFNWFLLSGVSGAAVGVTVIVWVSTNKDSDNWWKGFLICTIGALVGVIFLVVGKPFYRLKVPKDSPLVRVAEVIILAIRNRSLPHPESPDELYKVNETDVESPSARIGHTNQFRWLDKAAILSPNTGPSTQKVCTVAQVEAVKVLVRMQPIVASTVIMNTCLAQLQTFSVHQGFRMDPYLGSFRVPTASMPIMTFISMIIFIPMYDRIFMRIVRKFTKHPSGITQLQRMGVGLVLSSLSMLCAALVEVKRKRRSLEDPHNPISVFWLSFQYGIFGIAEVFTLVGSIEFFCNEAPLGMRSLSTSFAFMAQSFGYFLSSAFVAIINGVTRRISPSKQGWLHGHDLDKNNLNLFYWFLAILSFLNFFNYLYWSDWYKYKNDQDDSELVEVQ